MKSLYTYSACTYDELIPYAGQTYVDLVTSIHHMLPQSPRMLDVGCGTGFVLHELHKRYGYKKLFGVEPSSVMVSLAEKSIRKNIQIDIFKKNMYPKNYFDVVMCFHTLDHMRDPNMFVQEAYSLLRPGGHLIIVVHDVGSWSVSLMGERSPVFDIEHVYLFNKQTITQLLMQNKFYNISAHALRNTYPLWYWIHMSGLPFGLNDTMMTLSKTMQFGYKPLSIAAGNMYAIAQKPSR